MTIFDDLPQWIRDLFRTPNDLNHPFYYDEHGMIKGYEKVIQNHDKMLQNMDKIIETFGKIRELRKNASPLQEQVDKLEKHVYKTERQMIINDRFAVGEHIQGLKSIVALQKIFTKVLAKLPITTQTQTLLELQIFQKRSEPIIEHFRDYLDQRLRNQDEANKELT